MTELSWGTAADHDSGQLDENVHHEQPTGTDWAPADTIELGYPSVFSHIGATPEAYYPLAESSGTTAYDASGIGTDGTVSGPTQATSGILGKNAYSFDGVDDYVDTGSTYGTHGNNFGVSAWVVQDGWSVNWENVTNCWAGSNNGGWALQRYDTETYISMYVNDTVNEYAAQATTSIVDGAWHHVHGQFDIGNQVEIWIDGTLDNTVSAGSHDETVYSGNHWIASQPNADDSGENYWGGNIAHVVYWDGLLTSDEVALLADPTVGTHTSSTQTS